MSLSLPNKKSILEKPAMRFLSTALDALLPPRCIATGEIVERPGMISPAFWAELTFIEKPMCETCGMPFPFAGLEGSLCGGCLEHPPDFDCARAAVVYNDPSRKLVLDFKYGDRLHAAETFVPWMLRNGQSLINTTDMIIPVPLHRWRLWQRRFNQAAILGRTLARTINKDFHPDILQRIKHTIPQKGLSRAEREQNVRGAFAVNPAKKTSLKNKNILLIDDVFTSGATLNACARALKNAGASQVNVLTIARVLKEEL